jgi:ABC-type Fe3+ transport system permease subunit
MLPLAVPGLVMAFGYLAVSLQLQAFFSNCNWLPRLAGHLPYGTVALVHMQDAWSSVAMNLHLTSFHAEVRAFLRNPKQLRDIVNVTENPTLLLVIAYAMRRLPYVVRSAVAGLEQTPVDLELAAKNLGASGGLTLRRITIPLISANLIAGGLLAFAFAMLEVSDSLILAQKQQYWPITRAIYELFQALGNGPYIASALGVWAMVLLTLTILSANSLLGKRMGAVFRV